MVQVVQAAPAKRCTCRVCASVLEYHYHDITSEYIRDYGGGGDTYYRITCPVCQSLNNVSKWK
jgi:ribosomal protein S27E